MSLEDPTTLLGTWVLHREVEDRYAGEHSVVEGTLTLARESVDRLRWREDGVWRRPQGDVPVARTLWVDRTEDGWWVRFEDGRDFHPWSPGREVRHDCRPDVYVGLVTGSAEQWSVRWDSTGPTKDYSMLTLLSRGAGGP